MGEITDSQISGQNIQILAFAQKARKMLEFMGRFNTHLSEMEIEFEASVDSTY